MALTFQIHPSIGIARVGTSPTDFYLCPEQEAALPILCDRQGNAILKDGQEQPITSFRDANNLLLRQAARFRVYVYDGPADLGHELKTGDKISWINNPKGHATGQRMEGTLQDIQWSVYLANKKSNWYEFKELEGEHGYSKKHKLRNDSITDAEVRQSLIIDPGPQKVSSADPKNNSAQFAATGSPLQSFPPPLQPNSITTLGEIKGTKQDGYNRMVVLGGLGNSGTMNSGFGEPSIQHFANNEGWFDDIADGPVTAELVVHVDTVNGYPDPEGPRNLNVAVNGKAWVIVGYPRYAPQITDVITMNDLITDVSIQHFGFNPRMFGVPPFDGSNPPPAQNASAQDWQTWRDDAIWNNDYYPYFWRDIWPILVRPNNYQTIMSFDGFVGGDPHDTAAGGNFDPGPLSTPPYHGQNPEERAQFQEKRRHIYKVLRMPGQENSMRVQPDPDRPDYLPYGMPLLMGNNPLSNTVVEKFLRLTDTMLFMLKQWAHGKFIDEHRENITPVPDPPGLALDRGVLANVLGGSFCPGGETSWIMRNPVIYEAPFRLHHASGVVPGSLSQPKVAEGETSADLAAGLEPGDVTKYDAVPWQADFNECSHEDVDITYERWNLIYPKSTGDPVKKIKQDIYWWPAHRPWIVNNKPWSPTPQTHAGDLEMVTIWKDLGFITGNATDGFNLVQSNIPGQTKKGTS